MKRLSGALFALSLPLAAAAEPAPARTPAELLTLQEEIAAAERRQAEDAAARQTALQELDALKTEAARSAAAIQDGERQLTESERRIGELDARQAALQRDLDARRTAIAPLLAALQRLSRDPPPALAVAPEDAVAAARGAMLMASVTDRLNAEAQALSATLTALGETRTALVAERAAATRQQEALRARAADLALTVERRQALIGELERNSQDHAARIAALQARAADMTDLMVWLESDEGQRLRPGATAEEANHAPVTVAARGAGMPFAKRRGALAWPAAGAVAERFGEAGPAGTSAHGVTLTTREAGQVTAPADGEIVFAGPFGDYGRLLILAPGEGYFVLIGGFGRLDVAVGQYVLAGEPLGVTAGAGEASGSRLYIELRRDGVPIDPLPWFTPIQAAG